jgi:hypothetical protein
VFNANTTAYTLSVPNSVSSISIAAAANHAEATVADTGSHSLKVGENTFTVEVTAQDGTTTQTYTVTVTRASPPASTDATLSSLTVSPGDLSPTFSANTTAYTLSVPNSVTGISIAAAANHAEATVADTGSHSLNVGANTFSILVTAEDGTTTLTYTVTVNRATETASADATLSSLTVSPGDLSPTFSANTTAYTLSVPNSVSSISIAAVTSHAGARISGTGSKELSEGANTISIVVTAEDGTTTKTYTVTITRQPLNTGVEDAQQAKVALYPNPVVDGELRVEGENLKIGEKIAIYSASGKLVGTYEVSGAITIINVAHLAAGVYIVTIGRQTAKIAINH